MDGSNHSEFSAAFPTNVFKQNVGAFAEVGHSQSLDLALVLLFVFPFVFEHRCGTYAFLRPRILSRLVECSISELLLAQLEHSSPSMVHSSHVHPLVVPAQGAIYQILGEYLRFSTISFLPRVCSLSAIEHVPVLGVHGNVISNAAIDCGVQIPGPYVGQHRSVDIAHNWAATVHSHVLPRLLCDQHRGQQFIILS